MTDKNTRQMPGLYIHVPFCWAKCPYCDFYSVAASHERMADYVSQTRRLLFSAAKEFPEFTPDTLYFGGGTPSILGEEGLLSILETAVKLFRIPTDGEITLEANPGTVSLPMLRSLRTGGFNRISFGVQSAVSDELAFLGRKHTAAESRQAVLQAWEAGFSRISLDLMLGLAGQTEETLSRSLDFCASLPAEHISAYLLKIEPNTLFFRRQVQNLCPDEDRQADLYLAAVKGLDQRGFQQYEISSFAKKGHRALHNLKYWDGIEYLGIGPGAHSFWAGRRYSIPRDLKGYLTAPSLADLLTDEGEGGSLEEYLMLRLRLSDGIRAEALKRRYPSAKCWENLCRRAQPFHKAGLLKLSSDPDIGQIAFTAQGFLVSNSLIAHIV